MALTEEVIIDKIEVVEKGSVQVRTAIIIKRDGAEVSRTFHRHALAPGDSLDGQPARVRAIATAVWTDEVIAAYQATET